MASREAPDGDCLGTFGVVVVGSGAAGLSAAEAASAGPSPSVAIVSRAPLGEGGSTPVSHAINAALGENDSVERHFEDTLRAGCGLGDPALVEVLVRLAPRRIRELEVLGCVFAKTPEGRYAANSYGGSRVGRGVRGAVLVGPMLAEALRRSVRSRPVAAFEGLRLVDALVCDGSVAGAVFFDARRGRLAAVRCKALVLAAGGGATMYARSSAGETKTCDGIAAAFRCGARLVDIEMIQFHPTGLLRPGDALDGRLVPEEFRSQGATLSDGEGRAVEAGPAPTRDLLCRAIEARVRAGKGTPGGGVSLDLGRVPPSELERLLSTLDAELAGVLAAAPGRRAQGPGRRVEVFPTAHSMIGGVAINAQAGTGVAGLYACGEDAGGVHGANRIGGNGLAESLVFGAVAGRAAARFADEAPETRMPEARRSDLARSSGGSGLRPLLTGLRRAMWEGCGIVRSETDLKRLDAALAERATQLAAIRPSVAEMDEYLDYRSLLEVSRLVCAASLLRDSNAGAFYKTENEGRPPRAYNVVVEPSGCRIVARP